MHELDVGQAAVGLARAIHSRGIGADEIGGGHDKARNVPRIEGCVGARRVGRGGPQISDVVPVYSHADPGPGREIVAEHVEIAALVVIRRVVIKIAGAELVVLVKSGGFTEEPDAISDLVMGYDGRILGRRHVEPTHLETIAVAGCGGRHGAGNIAAERVPAILHPHGHALVYAIETVVAVPPGTAAS